MILSMQTWWEALNGTEQMYWAIALIASSIFIIQLILTLIGLDADIEADFDDGSGIGIISLRGLVTFATFFGWTGIGALHEGYAPAKTLMIAFLFGFMAMVSLAYLLSKLLKLQESGTIDNYDAITQVGDVYIPIPEAKDGKGRIHITLQNKLMEFDAISDGPPIKTGVKVKVIDVLNENVMLVKAI